MVQCPSCDTKLDEDYGIVTCPSCRAVLMIDVEGDVRVGTEAPVDFSNEEFNEDSDEESTAGAVFRSGHEETESSQSGQASALNPPSDASSNTSSIDLDALLSNEGLPEETNGGADTYEDFGEENLDEDEAEDDDGFDAITGVTGLDESEESLLSDDLFDEDDEGASESSDEWESADDTDDIPIEDVTTDDEGSDEDDDGEPDFGMATEPDNKPVDVTSYANSEASSLEDGEYLYDVKIARIDSKDLKQALKYVLLDEKLKLNHHEFLKKIRDGAVTIPDLNPIKAKRIVEQLQYFDLDIKWTQKRVIIETVEPTMEDEGSEVIEDVDI